MQKLKEMMTRVNGSVSKGAAENVKNMWYAVCRGDMSISGKVTFSAHDYATIQNYAEACAKKAGII